MKHLFFLLLIYFLPVSLLFSKEAGDNPVSEKRTNNISASKIFVDKFKNIYVTGSFTGIVRFGKNLVLGSYGKEDIFIAKYDSTGICLWATNAGSDGDDEGESITADESGYVYVTGFYKGDALFGQTIILGGRQQNFFAAKYNSSGDPVWIIPGNGKGGSYGCDIKLDKFNNCYVAASFYDSLTIEDKTIAGFGGSDILLLKFSSKGELIWDKAVGGKKDDVVNSSSLLVDGDAFYVSGSFNDTIKFNRVSLASNGSGDAFLVKYNTNGEAQWAKHVGGKGLDYATGVCTDNEGSIYLAGNFDSTFCLNETQIANKGEFDVFFVKFDSAGKSQWIQSFGTGGNEKSQSFVTDQIGNFYIGGSFTNSSNNNESFSNMATFGKDLFVVKYKGMLKDEWSLLAGGNGNDEVVDMCADNQGCLYILGSYYGSIKIGDIELTNSGGNELFFAKVNQAGTFSFVKKAVSPEPNFTDKNKYVNYYAKLMHGKGKSSLVDQVVNLKDSKGDVIKSTKTDIFGDFSFKGISAEDSVNIVLEKNESLPAGEPIYLANQKGEIIKELAKDKNNDFTFDVLSNELMKLIEFTDEDNADKLDKFIAGTEKEITVNENILYKHGAWDISAENTIIINKLVEILKQNSGYKIEIYSYTDAVGEAQANMVLSEKRATAIVDFFIKKGIKIKRIKGQGFGETKIINRCVDGVECSEKEHQVNRRTEFKLIK